MLASSPICFASNFMFWTVFETYSLTRSVKICIEKDRKVFRVG